MWFKLHFALLSLAAFGSVIASDDLKDFQDAHRFDFFVFSQLWPITSCDIWEDKNPSNTCFLPIETRGRWTVHGLWPSKFESKQGPFNCNNIPFRPTLIEPIRDKLNAQWTDVHQNGPKDNFWEHEWSKHGTCAMQLEALSNELKYFSTGIQLNDKYDISKMLSASNIVPGKGYTGNEIIQHLTTSLGKKPSIACVRNKGSAFDEKNLKYLLSEIRICLDKNLTLIDCKSNPIQDCSWNETVNFYPDIAHKKMFYTYPSPPLLFGVICIVIVMAIAMGLFCLCYQRGIKRQRGYENI